MDEDRLHVIVIDGNSIARRKDIVELACQDLRRAETTRSISSGTEIAVKLIESEDDAIRYLEQRPQVPPLILVVVEETELCSFNEKNSQRIPCRSVHCGYELINHMGVENDIYFVVRGNITGLDVMSMLLSGARGVLDVDTIGSPELLRVLIERTRQGEKTLHRLAVGRPFLQLDGLLEMARRKWQIEQQHWTLLLALAETPLIRLPSSHPPKQNHIANELHNFSPITGYVPNERTQRMLPKVLQYLLGELEIVDEDKWLYDVSDHGARLLNPDSKAELPYLPVYARLIGLPQTILPIRNVQGSELAQRLYKGLRGIECPSSADPHGIKIGRLTIERSLHDP